MRFCIFAFNIISFKGEFADGQNNVQIALPSLILSLPYNDTFISLFSNQSLKIFTKDPTESFGHGPLQYEISTEQAIRP